MTADFTHFDPDREAMDAFVGEFSGDLAPDRVADHWLDEALRAVPLPDGFLTRMTRLAERPPAPARTGDPA